jgi:hypothetical protein
LIRGSCYPLWIRLPGICVREAIAEGDLTIHSLDASRIRQFLGGCDLFMLHPIAHAYGGDERNHPCGDRKMRPNLNLVHILSFSNVSPSDLTEE